MSGVNNNNNNDNDGNGIQFLENYVLSKNRLKTVSQAFNEDTEEYWRYSLLYMLNKCESAADPQMQAFLKKLDKTKFRKSDFIQNLLFRQQLRKFDQSTRAELVAQICGIINLNGAEIGLSAGADDDEKANASGAGAGADIANTSSAQLAGSASASIGTTLNKKGNIVVDIPGAISTFLRQSSEQYLHLADKFTPSAVDFIVGDAAELETLSSSQIAGLIDLLKDSAPKCRMLLPLILRDMKENDTEFGSRAIHQRLTVGQMNELGVLDASLFKNLPFVQIMARKLRPISDVYFENNERYLGAYFDKLRSFALGPLKHTTFKALILYNYLTFFEGYSAGGAGADANSNSNSNSEAAVAAFQAAEYGNEQPSQKLASKKTGGKAGKGGKTGTKAGKTGGGGGRPLRLPSYDKKTLAAYLSLVRASAQVYAAANLKPSAKQSASEVLSADLSFDCAAMFPELRPIANDVAFVERAVGYFFSRGENSAAWPMLDKPWAMLLFAKTKLMGGKLSEKLAKNQTAAIVNSASRKYYNSFCARSVLQLLPTNAKFFSVADAISFQYYTKNNPTLHIKVYQLNPLRYYREHWNEIPLALNLSGIVPKVSITKKSKDKNVVKKADQITLKSLAGQRGVFVIDFIGNNITQRVIVFKGEYRFIYEQSTAGYEFFVFNELNVKVTNARIYTQSDSKVFSSDAEGKIVIPYLPSAFVGAGAGAGARAEDVLSISESVIVEDCDRAIFAANLRTFLRKKREYQLEGGFFIDRENLIAKEEAVLVLRTNLYLCQERISAVEHLNNTYVTFECKTLDGEIVREIQNIALDDFNDTELRFTVPAFIREVQCTLFGRVRCPCKCSAKACTACKCCRHANSTQLSISQLFRVNGIDACPFIADVVLLPDAKQGYVLKTVGKNGETFADEEIEIKLFHRFFSRPLVATVSTNEAGLIELGQLDNILKIGVLAKNTLYFSWNEKFFNLMQNMVNVPQRINQRQGTVVRIPFSAKESSPPIVSVYDSNFSSDVSNAATYANGYIVIKQLPAGDYYVFVEDMIGATINLHISNGPMFSCELGDYVLSNSRILQLSPETPLQITAVKPSTEGFEIAVSNSRGMNRTRVHVVINNLLPTFTPYQCLATPDRYPDVIDFVRVASEYSPTQACDEEYLYITKRQKAKTVKYIGNNLAAPSLLQAKWQPPQIISQVTEPQHESSANAQSRFGMRYPPGFNGTVFGDQFLKCDDTSDIEFLNHRSLVFTNLKPDENGIVTVPAFKQAHYRCLQIIAVDAENTALYNHTIANPSVRGNGEILCKDTRLNLENDGFAPSAHFALAKNIIPLKAKNANYTIRDFSSADYAAVSTMSDLFDIFVGLEFEKNVQSAKALNRFRPLMANWTKLTEKQKLDTYDRLQCHEVNFFLSRKDPTFFEEVVTKCIKNKLKKDFVDEFLLQYDLSRYSTDSFLFSTLNIFEKILLCARFHSDAFAIQALKSMNEVASLLDTNIGGNLFASAHKYKNQIAVLLASAAAAAANNNNNNNNAQDAKDEEDEKDGGGRPRNNNENGPHALFTVPGSSSFKFDETLVTEERRYYDIPALNPTKDLITLNTMFWRDFAQYFIEENGKGAFLSAAAITATSSINEILLVLACMDLPFEAADPTVGRARNQALSSKQALITSNDACLLFVSEFIPSQTQSASVLSVHSNYFDPKDSSEEVHGEKVDKFVVTNFETRKIYGCRSVITNVSSVEQMVEVLLQIPCGSIQVNMSYATKSFLRRVKPFKTERLTYYFYFPVAGEFSCFPVHVNSLTAETIAYTLDERLNSMIVGDTVAEPNRESWDWLIKSGSNANVVRFLETNPRAYEVDLARLQPRLLKNPKFFDTLTAALKMRGIYDERVWKFALVSDKGGQEIIEFISQSKLFLEYIHPYYKSAHFNYDPFERCDWTFTEFYPLINPRSINSRQNNGNNASQNISASFLEEYGKFLIFVAFRSFSRESISCIDRLMFINFLLNQGRINLSRLLFSEIDNKEAMEVSPLTLDYFDCYFNIYSGEMSTVKKTLIKCMNWTVRPLPTSIRDVWLSIQSIAEEVENPASVDNIFEFTAFERKRKQEQLMSVSLTKNFANAKQPKMVIHYRNCNKCVLKFFRIDLELLFSQSPFAADSNSYDLISPNAIKKIDLPPNASKFDFAFPDEYRGQNTTVVCQVYNSANAKEKREASKTVYDHQLTVQMAQNVSQLRVMNNSTKKPLFAAYVKMYSRDSGDRNFVSFFKDGYTDIRGRFNYALSSNQWQNSAELAVFVAHPDLGSMVVEFPTQS